MIYAMLYGTKFYIEKSYLQFCTRNENNNFSEISSSIKNMKQSKERYSI